MPSRWLRWLIVGFWLTTTGWLFWHDLWPSWRPGEPPPFYIDPVEEVHKQDPLKTNWTVLRRKSKEAELESVFSARTWVECSADEDAYALVAQLDAKTPGLQPVYVGKLIQYKIEFMATRYVVTNGGQLRSLRAELKAIPQLGKQSGFLSSFLDRVSFVIQGKVRDDQFFAHCEATMPPSPPFLEFDLPPTAVSHTASVLMPLHPVNRIKGLHPGQRWRQPLVDPLRDAFAALPGFGGGVRELQAHVLEQAQTLQDNDRATSCLVVEYTDNEGQLRGRTWVEQDSERVQQQEAYLEGTEWIMRRESSTRLTGPLPKRPLRKP